MNILKFAKRAYAALRSKLSDNEFADGIEIPEEEIASAIEGDMATFVANENAKRYTARLVNYTADQKARLA
jgi:hypothetical protein